MKHLTLAIDFDGCITKLPIWPGIGELRPDAKIIIKRLYEDGHTIIINTLRAGNHAIRAMDFLNHHKIPYH